MKLGYTTGVFDLFHIGHLTLLRNARALCDRLVVGVTTDELLLDEKQKHAVIPHHERMEIVRAITHVDAVVAQEHMDKMAIWERLRFDVMFVGDDWFDTPRWHDLADEFERVGVKIIYFPYTKGTSSTLINQVLEERRAVHSRHNDSEHDAPVRPVDPAVAITLPS